MSCEVVATGVIVCGSGGNPNCICYRHCPTCKTKRRMLMHYAGMYYGHDVTCLTCADRWQDGELAPRPFRPDWQEEVLGRVRVLAAKAVTRREYHDYCQADFNNYFDATA